MGDRYQPMSDEVRLLLERVDAICREAEAACAFADTAMKHRLVWPEPEQDSWPATTDERRITSPDR